MKKMKASQAEDEEKRKLKTSNTTLRGEKTVLNNQLSALKKNYAEKVEICDLQDMEIKQLKAQVDKFTTTMKWQSETIGDLRSTVTGGLNRVNQEAGAKIQKLEELNERLVKALLMQ